jgi:hypothetical protein
MSIVLTGVFVIGLVGGWIIVGGGFGGTKRFVDWVGGGDGMQEYTTVLAQVRLADLTEYTCFDNFTADEGIGSFPEVV